jgi:Zn-dependent protease
MRMFAMILAVILNLMVWGAIGEVGLPERQITTWLIAIALSFVAILAHEAGHAVAVRLTGGTVQRIVVFPFELRLRPMRLAFAKRSGKGDIGGYVAYSPSPARTRRDRLIVPFAGPAANFLLALGALAGGICFSGNESERSFMLLANALAILSAGMGFINLIPFKGSDGAAISRALKIRPGRATVS